MAKRRRRLFDVIEMHDDGQANEERIHAWLVLVQINTDDQLREVAWITAQTEDLALNFAVAARSIHLAANALPNLQPLVIRHRNAGGDPDFRQ